MIGQPVKSQGKAFAFSQGLAKDLNVSQAAPNFILTVTNTGRRPVLVLNRAIKSDKKKSGHDHFVYMPRSLPKMLKEGEFATEYTEDLSILDERTKQVFVWDTTGKKWRMSRRELSRLKREVEDLDRSESA